MVMADAIRAYALIILPREFQYVYTKETTTSLPASSAIAKAIIIGLDPNKALKPITDTRVPSASIARAVKKVIMMKIMKNP
jgi:hypothetical protein